MIGEPKDFQNQEKNSSEQGKAEKLENMEFEKQVKEVVKTSQLLGWISGLTSEDEKRKKRSIGYLGKYGGLLDSVNKLSKEDLAEIDELSEKEKALRYRDENYPGKDERFKVSSWGAMVTHTGGGLLGFIKGSNYETEKIEYKKEYQHHESRWKELMEQCTEWEALNRAHEILREQLAYYTVG